jgi:hypothetical protein
MNTPDGDEVVLTDSPKQEPVGRSGRASVGIVHEHRRNNFAPHQI